MATVHPWRFFRAGGFNQVRLDSGADLMALDLLDQKLWVALACPTTSIAIDSRTLALLDTDGDKRVRATELITAAKWAGGLLNDPDALLVGSSELAVGAINTGSDEGKALADAASRVLVALGKAKDGSITVAEASEAVKALYASPVNGDGIIVEKTASTEELRSVIRDIVACQGADADRSGTGGVTQKKIDDFFSEVNAHLAWRAEGEANPATAPLNDATADARATLKSLKGKIDDFFARCRLAAFDARAGLAMNREEKDYLALSAKELSNDAADIAAFPLAHVSAGRALPLVTGVNPAWDELVMRLRATVISPLMGEKDALTEKEWVELKARFAAHDAWIGKKAGASVEKLGPERLAVLAGGKFKEALTALVSEDLAIEPVAKAVAGLEKLVRLHRDLFRLCNNFVSFKDFYSRQQKAVFQAGTLYIDQRSCELCIRVDDSAKHALMAPLARTYLAYCECQRDGKKMTIAAAFTAGDSDNLMVGRNGVFYDRDGKDWDATITRIVDNPISIGDAFWSPYKKLIRFIEEQSAKRAAEADSAANARLTTAASEVGTAAEKGRPAEPVKSKIDIGMVAAIGVAVGGLTAALGVMMQAFFGLGMWMPLGLVGLILAISGPSMAVAWLKLRQRNLAPLLDANGWAMNSPARINIPFGTSLTQTAALPPGAGRDLRDPYAEKSTPWAAYATAACMVALCWFWASGRADPFLPENARKAHVWPGAVTGPRSEQQAAKLPAVVPEKQPTAVTSDAP